MAERQGLVMGIVMGIVLLVIAVIIAFVVVQEMGSVGESIEVASTIVRVESESIAGVSNVSTNDTAAVGSLGLTSFSISTVYNHTDAVLIGSTNYTVGSSGTIIATAAGQLSSFANKTWNVTYAYKFKGTSTASNRLRSNFTAGVDEVSDKIPTVLLIAAVVLILGILALLVVAWRRMQMEGSGAGGI